MDVPLSAALLLVRTLSFTAPGFLSDTTTGTSMGNPCSPGALVAREALTIRLYGAKAYQSGWTPVLLRSHFGITPGAVDTFQVYDAEPWTYWVEPVNSAGPGCRVGVTVGIPLVNVPFVPRHDDKLEYYDLHSRRLGKEPETNGIYFVQFWRAGRLVYTEKRVKLK